MHEDLIKRLRRCEKFRCRECEYEQVMGCRAKLNEEAADTIEELTRENESLAKSVNEASEILRRRWIPVTERLPRMWEEVMLRFPNNQAVGFHDGDSGWAVFSGDNMYTYVAPEEVHPTHWKPKEE